VTTSARDGYLDLALRLLDRVLHREIMRLRARYQLSLDEFRGLYVSDEQVDRLVRQSGIDGGDKPGVAPFEAEVPVERADGSRARAADPRWQHLIEEFALTPFECDVLLLALAPEIDLKYETLYAYLNNDVTRKCPTRDLALRVCDTEGTSAPGLRGYLLNDATLFVSGILRLAPPQSEHLSWLARSFSAAPAVTRFLLGLRNAEARRCGVTVCDVPPVTWAQVPVSEEFRADLVQAASLFQPRGVGKFPVVVFEGHDASGRGRAAAALANALGVPLVRVDLERARGATESFAELLQDAVLEQRLLGALVHIDLAETLFDRDGGLGPEASVAMEQFRAGSRPLVLSVTPDPRWRTLLQRRSVVTFRFAEPGYAHRVGLWIEALRPVADAVSSEAIRETAARFVLTAGQIAAAATAAWYGRQLSDQASGPLTADHLFAAARAQTGDALARLATKARTNDGWDDLVLPETTLHQVKDITAAIRYRHLVYSDWGFERRVASGQGLTVLFSGASGTGKTMTARVIARESGLDLYTINLAGVVSKYIGETEKNLDRIFRAARCSNAILFFDEADALFGKRSEVKDAHDRYANIEVAYLLQKMEDHDGVVVLATNLAKNIDQAFARRMRYVVEFPLPGEVHRERLWRLIFPPQVPLAHDIEFGFLAKQFAISGGDIRNVALDAAFLAAEDGQVVTMRVLIMAMARQMLKQGRTPAASEFKEYFSMVQERP